MTEQRSATTDGITAGLLREDFRRSSGRSSMKCVAPNRRCGNRCIPPEWDCRLKGEGDDPHLKAVGAGSDPVAGFANIERGLQRLGKGVTKLSFSEIEGGRRAIARGTAKLSPGDLQKKKELQDKVYKFGLIVGAPISLAIFAGLSHRGLKVFPQYRTGVGRQVDEAIGGAIRQVRRNNPLGGQQFRAKEAAGPEAVQRMANLERNLQAGGPDIIRERAYVSSGLTRAARTTVAGTGQESGRSALIKSLNAANEGKKGFNEWEEASLKAFWSTKDVAEHNPAWLQRSTEGSVFSVPAATRLYADSMGFKPNSLRVRQQANDVVDELAKRLRTTGALISDTMRLQGLNPADTAAVNSFVRSIPLARPISRTADFQERYYSRLVETVTKKDYTGQAKSLFKSTVTDFDKLFQEVALSVNDRPNITAMPRGQGRNRMSEIFAGNFYRDGSRAWTETLVEQLRLPEDITRTGAIQGPGTSLLLRKVYHTNFVMKSRGINRTARAALTRTEAMTAGSEVATALGRPSPQTADQAVELLNFFYGGANSATGKPTAQHLGPISLIEARPSAASPRATSKTKAPAPAKAPTRAAAKRAASGERWQRLKGIMEERNPDGSKRYSSYAAAVAELERRNARGDVAPQERSDFTPQDSRLGKPCGNGFVAKQKKCSKPAGKGYAKPPEGYRGGFMPQARKTPHAPSGETTKKVATVAAGAIALAAGGRAAYANRARLRAGIKRVNPELYNRVASRTSAARRAVQKQARDATLKVSTATINTLSSEQVKQGLDRIPAQWQDQARSLVGKAKVGAAYVAARAQDMEVINVNTKSNFTTFRAPSGHMLSVGSSGDALLTFNSEAKGKVVMPNGAAYDKYGMAFQVDLSFDQRKSMSRSQSSKIVRDTKAMFTDQIQNMPDNAFIFVKAHADDGLGDKRSAVYTKWGFRELKGVRGGNLWALKNEGKFTKIPETQDDYIAELLRGRRDSLREDKKCGKSGIPDNRKCTVPTQPTSGAATKPSAAPERGVLKAGLAVGSVAVLATALATRHKWTPAVAKAYRQAVAKAKQQGKGKDGGIFSDETLSNTAYMAEGRNGAVYVSMDEKSIFKVAKGKVNEQAFVREIYTQSKLHKAGVSVPEIKAYEIKRGIVQMEYLKNHKSLLNAPLADRSNNYKTLVGELHKMAKAGFSHGDLHAGNVLVDGSDLKIIDFGTARKAGDSLIADINKLTTDLEPTAEAKAAIVALRKPLEQKISSGKGLDQTDAVTFYERLLASLS